MGASSGSSLAMRGLGDVIVSQPPPFPAPASGCSTVQLPGRPGITVIVRDGRVTVISVQTKDVTTRSGVAVGQLGSRVPAVYAGLVTQVEDGFIYRPGLGPDQDLAMSFEVVHNRVSHIRTGEWQDVIGDCKGGDLQRARGTLSPGVAPPPAPAATTNVAITAVPAATADTPASGRGQKLVVIDAGHNGANGSYTKQINKPVDAGGFTKPCNTTGTTSLSGLTEATFNFAVARRLGVLLEARGWIVVYTRTDNAGWGPCVDERGRTAGRSGAAALLSIHADGASSSAHGFHVIWPKPLPRYTASTAAASSLLATSVRDAMMEAGFTPSTYIGRKGIDNRSDLGTLNLASTPSMMIECGNMKNAADDRTLSSEDGQQRIAVAVVVGFERWNANR